MSTLETGTDHLLGRIEGHVAVLSFNRPEARNALSDEMYAGFGKALPLIAANSDIRVLMLTGEGVAFCSGGDQRVRAKRGYAYANGNNKFNIFTILNQNLIRYGICLLY